MGAWIEISSFFIVMASIPVAPLVGAWIEIEYHRQTRKVSNVAPLVGAWIEIDMCENATSKDICRSSCRSVD